MSGKCIVVTSGKGGVGKTTSTANIGSARAMYGPKVVLIDTDIGLRNLDLLIGLENRILYDLTHVVEGKCPVRKALIKHKKLENLSFLPASMSKDKEELLMIKKQQLPLLFLQALMLLVLQGWMGKTWSLLLLHLQLLIMFFHLLPVKYNLQ